MRRGSVCLLTSGLFVLSGYRIKVVLEVSQSRLVSLGLLR